MSKLRLCLDIDNVLTQTDAVMRRVIADYTAGRVRYDYGHIQEFDYHKCKDADGCSITRDEWKPIHELFSEPSNVLTVRPVHGIQSHLETLREKYHLHLATA